MTDEYFNKVLEREYKGASPRELSPLVLAYVGDAVYEILARYLLPLLLASGGKNVSCRRPLRRTNFPGHVYEIQEGKYVDTDKSSY